jgi:hypothetical protein
MAGKDGINCGGAGATKVTRMSKPKFVFWLLLSLAERTEQC